MYLTMKKISLICAVAIAGLSLSACGHNSSKNKNTTSKQTSSKVVKKHHKKKINKHSDKNKKASSSSAVSASSQQNSQQQTQSSGVIRDKDGRVINGDGTRGPIPSPYKEGTPQYDQWHGSISESIRASNNEPDLQLGPEPRADNTQ